MTNIKLTQRAAPQAGLNEVPDQTTFDQQPMEKHRQSLKKPEKSKLPYLLPSVYLIKNIIIAIVILVTSCDVRIF